jgi:DNA-binding NtrC family response regulator
MKQQFDAVVEQLLSGGIFLEEAIELLECRMIEGALKLSAGKQTAASKRLGIHRNTLQRKMVQFHLGTTRTRRKPAVRAARTVKRKSPAA